MNGMRTRNKPLFCQCLMERKTEGGKVTVVSYIPAKFAKVGGYVKLKQEDGTWIDHWKVISAGEPTEEPLDPRVPIKEHRKRTGDSLPKAC